MTTRRFFKDAAQTIVEFAGVYGIFYAGGFLIQSNIKDTARIIQEIEATNPQQI